MLQKESGEIRLDLIKLQESIEEIKLALSEAREIDTLSMIIDDVKAAFEAHWEEEYLPFASKIRNAISRGIPTPVLTICGRGTQEIRYTSYLGYFLDPGKKHGLGSSLLKAVLDPHAEGLKESWAEECQVQTELWIGDEIGKHGKILMCFCDIGVIGSDFAFIIEQKILSAEDAGSQVGLSQLLRYSSALAKNPEYNRRNLIKIFLTPTGRLPQRATDWIPLSYTQVIDRAYGLYKTGALSPVARGNLCRLIIDLVMGPYKVSDALLEEIYQASEELLKSSISIQAIVSYRRIIENNRLLINLITEGD